MEDHRDAYFFWKELGVQGAACVHVDAHLDVSNFQVPMAGLHSPEVNCANFLIHAIRDGIVKHLVWVVPPHLKGEQDWLSWMQVELQNWVRPLARDLTSLKLKEGRVEGTLEGARFTVCAADALPALQGPVLLDIDVDYYLDTQDGAWQSPFELKEQLGPLQTEAVTIAYSVTGGYTPLAQRYLGDLTRLVFSGDEDTARRLQAELESPEPPAEDRPSWVRAAWHLKRSAEDHEGEAWERAAGLDPSYKVNRMDVASLYLQRKNSERCKVWLDKLEGVDALLGQYLRGMLAGRLGEDEEALRSWKPLLEQATDKDIRSHLLELCARAESRLKRDEEALKTLQEAVKLTPGDPSLWLELARTQATLGKIQEAMRTYRKCIAKGGERLSAVEAQVELAKLYAAEGQVALAQAECQRVVEGEGPSWLKLEAQMLQLRLARGFLGKS